MTSSDHDDARPSSRKHRFPRPLLWIIEGLGAVLATITIAVVILAVRLVVAPLDIGFLTPQVVAWADARLDPYTVTIGKTRLRWELGRSTIELQAVDAQLHAPLKDAVAGSGSTARPNAGTGPSVLGADLFSVSLGLRPLLHKRIQPSRVTMTRPHIMLVRSSDGTIAIPGFAPQPTETPTDWNAIVRTLDQLAGPNPARSNASVARLDRVFINHGSVTLDDRLLGAQWSLSDLGIVFQRTATGWTVTTDGAAGVGEARSHASIETAYSVANRRVNFSVEVSALDPSAWIANVHKPPPGLASLGAVHLPVQAHLTGFGDLAQLALGPVHLSLKGESGNLVDTRLARGVLAVAGFDVATSYDPAARHAALTHATLDLGGATIDASGHADQLPILFHETPTQVIPGVLDITLHNLPASRFEATWPPTAAPNPRRWVLAHLTGGTLAELQAHLAAKWDPQSDALKMNDTSGTMKLAGFNVDYLPGLPPAGHVDANASFNPQRFDFTIQHADINGVTLSDGKASIDGLQAPLQTMTLDLPINGPLVDVVSLLAMDRLKLAQRAGLSPDGITGDVDGTLHFAFPLLDDLPLEKLSYSAAAKLNDVTLPKVVLSRDLTDGVMTLDLTTKLLSLAGTAKIDTNPAVFQWSQRVSGNAPDIMRATVKTVLDSRARARFGFDVVPDMVSGPVGIDTTYVQHEGGRSEAALNLDLKPTALTIDTFNWAKAPDVAAHASLTVMLINNHLQNIKDLKIDAPDLAGEGDLDFDEGSTLRQAIIRKLDFSGSQVKGEVDRRNGNWDINLMGSRIDLSKFLKDMKNSKPSEPDTGPVIHAVLQTDQLVLGEKRSLDHAKADLTLQGSLDELHLSGGIGHGKQAAVVLEDPRKGGHFSLTSDDLGSVLQIAGIADNIRGGGLSIQGENHRVSGKRVFTGHLEGHNYRVLNAPVMARLLTVSSPTSIVSLLTGNGIPFDVLVGELRLEGGVVTITDGRAHGSALGITANGSININANTIGLSGSVVPAYLLNGTIGKLPIVGNLLTGGAGKGLFAVNYSLGGSLDHVQISVNPLSVLAPGFLRNFFIFAAPKPAVSPVPAAPAQKP